MLVKGATGDTKTNDDHGLWHHMASLDHSELTHLSLNQNGDDSVRHVLNGISLNKNTQIGWVVLETQIQNENSLITTEFLFNINFHSMWYRCMTY